ncbi:MAG: hypothetical protein FWH22_08885 [Fibromonadales bacterium]|nr:hypothetical protein [Fibromonadales bacterium]
MIIVADTGPIISLAVIDKLSVLSLLFGDISIPSAVWEEFFRGRIRRLFEPPKGAAIHRSAQQG